MKTPIDTAPRHSKPLDPGKVVGWVIAPNNMVGKSSTVYKDRAEAEAVGLRGRTNRYHPVYGDEKRQI